MSWTRFRLYGSKFHGPKAQCPYIGCDYATVRSDKKKEHRTKRYSSKRAHLLLSFLFPFGETDTSRVLKSLLLSYYPMRRERNRPSQGSPVVIGEDCWIGAGVIIMPGQTIGKGSTVNAGSIVMRVCSVTVSTRAGRATTSFAIYGLCPPFPRLRCLVVVVCKCSHCQFLGIR